MRKLLLCAVLMLVALTTFAQGKEKVREFKQMAVELGVEQKNLIWSEGKTKVTLYPNGENKVSIEFEHGTDTFEILSVVKGVKDNEGKKCVKYILNSGNSKIETILYVYKRKKYGVALYLSLLDMYMYLKK